MRIDRSLKLQANEIRDLKRAIGDYQTQLQHLQCKVHELQAQLAEAIVIKLQSDALPSSPAEIIFLDIL
jgi:hypothetical protein